MSTWDNREQANAYYDALFAALRAEEAHAVEALAKLGSQDLFFLLTRLLGRKDINRDWLFDRCREVQAQPDFMLDLWAREHYKSTIITFGKTIQDILVNPDLTVGIFSHTRPIAKAFLKQIMSEFEQNQLLKDLYPDVLWQEPRKQAPTWSLDNGIIVKRQANPKEATIEAWGLVDGQPTSKHFSLLVYDDTVTRESVSTPEQILKTTDAWALSLNLGAHGGARRYIGTRYHLFDTYKTMVDREAATPRLHPATVDGTATGQPVFLDLKTLSEKRREMGPYVYACLGAGTLITMADWSQKPIEQVQVGDEVVGYAMVQGSKTTLTPTRVVATGSRMMPAVESVLEDGTTITHTPQHKWWTGRTDKSRNPYSPLGFAYHAEQKALCKALDLSFLNEDLSREQMAAAGYLAGIIDGEGGVRYRTIQITQDAVLHPQVCEKIEWALAVLGVEYAACDCDRRGKDHSRNAQGIQRIYTIHGGRQARVRLLHVLGGFLGKRRDLISQAYGSRNFGKTCRVALKSQRPIGEVEVFNIQTETGNYIADGFCSKNSQMLQNPKGDDVQGFNIEWVREWTPQARTGTNRYLIVDPAGSKGKTSDYTVMIVFELHEDQNYYLVDGLRDRLSLTQRGDALFRLHRKWRPLGVGYEKFGKDSDIEHFQDRMTRENYRFNITPLYSQVPKNERIRKLVPLFENGRIYTPNWLYFKDYEGKTQDFVKLFMEEYVNFPVSEHDDILDDMANIVSSQLGAVFPQPKELQAEPRKYDPLNYGIQGGN